MTRYLAPALGIVLTLSAGTASVAAADLGFSVDRWPCGTSPSQKARTEWSEPGVLSVEMLVAETRGASIEPGGALVEEKGDTLVLTYTERASPAGPVAACATPVVLKFRVSGLERKPANVRLMVRRDAGEVAVEG